MTLPLLLCSCYVLLRRLCVTSECSNLLTWAPKKYALLTPCSRVQCKTGCNRSDHNHFCSPSPAARHNTACPCPYSLTRDTCQTKHEISWLAKILFWWSRVVRAGAKGCTFSCGRKCHGGPEGRTETLWEKITTVNICKSTDGPRARLKMKSRVPCGCS